MRRPASARRIRAAVKQWQGLLGLGTWSFKVTVGPISGGHRATSEALPEYREVRMAFDPVAMLEAGDTVEATVIHEIEHLFNWRLARLAELIAGKSKVRQELVREALEDATTMMQQATQHLYHTLRRQGFRGGR